MNERIKELFNKAGLYAYEQNPGENSYGRPVDENKYEEDRYTKFAELIVRECAAMTRNLSAHGELAEKAVKEHFGVE
jgi:hypothetical protein